MDCFEEQGTSQVKYLKLLIVLLARRCILTLQMFADVRIQSRNGLNENTFNEWYNRLLYIDFKLKVINQALIRILYQSGLALTINLIHESVLLQGALVMSVCVEFHFLIIPNKYRAPTIEQQTNKPKILPPVFFRPHTV